METIMNKLQRVASNERPWSRSGICYYMFIKLLQTETWAGRVHRPATSSTSDKEKKKLNFF